MNRRTGTKGGTSTPRGASRLAARLFAVALALLAAHGAAAGTSAWTLISTSSSDPAPNWSPPDLGSGTQPAPAMADLNGDGKTDLIIGLQSGGIIAYENTGTTSAPVWSPAPAAWSTLSSACHILSESYYYAAPSLADLNGDGLPDLAIGVRDGVCLYENTGNTTTGPVWTRNETWRAALSSLPTNGFYLPALADIDNDGKADLVLGQTGDPLVFRNTGTTSQPAWTAEPAWEPGGLVSFAVPTVGDLDGDGLVDLMVADGYGDIFAFKNIGTAASPHWKYAPDWSPVISGGTSGQNAVAIALGDLNGDGRPDLMYSPFIAGAGRISVYEQNPAGLPPPGFASGTPSSGGSTVTDTFDSFSCPGGWLPAAGGVGRSYTRDCGNGWTAYAEDHYSAGIGYQNVVTGNTTLNGPSAATGTPLGVAEISTSPDTADGYLWLMKTFPVEPGVPVDTISADFRISMNDTDREYFGIVVFDGVVTNPSQTVNISTRLTSKILGSNLSLDGPLQCGTNPCPWHQVDVGGAVPSQSYITVAFIVEDVRSYNRPLMDIDNLVVSNVVNGTPPSLPVGDLAEQWNADYQDPGTNGGGQSSGPAEGKAVATDAAGNVYTLGDSDFDIATFKYDANGNLQWSDTYDGGDVDQAAAMAVDAAGNVYVTGRSYSSATSSFDYVVIKYDSGGTRQWVTTYDNLNRDDEPAGLAVDGSGNVYVTGSSCSGPADCKIATVQLSSGGTVQWHVLFDDGGAATVSTTAGIGLDGAGKVYVAGTSSGSEPDTIVAIKYDSTGAQQRLNRYQTGTGEQAKLMTTDAAGNVFIAGVARNGGNLGMVVLKYAAAAVDGDAPAWVKHYGANDETLPGGLTVDAAGDVYVTGSTGEPGNHDIVTIKYLANGDTAWAQTFDNSGGDDHGTGVAVDAGGNVYVIGSYAANGANTDMLLLKYDSSGVARAAISYDGHTVNDTAAGLVLNTDGDGDTTPIVVGTSADSTGLLHMATVRFERAFADLTASGIGGPANATVGDTITVSNSVLNIDNPADKKHRDSGPFTVALYLAPDLGGFADLLHLTPLGTRSAADLAPGQYSTDDTSVTIPTSVAEGDYFLVAQADSTGAVTERDETNNFGTVKWPISIAGTKPDLVVSNVSGPTSVTQGDTVTVSTTVADGVATPAAATFRVGIYLSSDSTITTGDTLLNSYTLSGLAGHTSQTTNTSVTIPTNLVSGNDYYIGAIADDQGAVDEADETNNSALVTTGTALSTQLVSSGDFIAGLPLGNNVGVTTSGGASSVHLAQSAVWTRKAAWDMPDDGGYAAPAPADLNGDGLPDILVGDVDGTLHAYVNKGGLTAPVWVNAPASWGALSQLCFAGITSGNPGDIMDAAPALADLNGDGLLDMVFGERDGVCLYENTGTRTSPAWTYMGGWRAGLGALVTNRFYVPALADLDGDGKVDLLLGWGGGNGFLAFQNVGTATAPAWSRRTDWENTSIPSSEDAPVLADLDGDGKVDLLLGDSAGALTAYRNTGPINSISSVMAPQWTRHSAWDLPDPDTSTNSFVIPGLADLNHDGRPDLLYGEQSGAAPAYENTGLFATSGTYLSNVVDAGTHGGFTTLSYTAVIPHGTTLTVDVRAGDNVQGAITANPGTGADGAFDSSTYDGSSIPGITGTSPSLTINTDNASQTIAGGDSVYPNGAGIFNFTDFSLANGDTITVTGSRALVIRTTGNATVAGSLVASAGANGAPGPGGYSGGSGTTAVANPGAGPGGGGASQYNNGGGGGYGGAGGTGGSNGMAGGPAYGTTDIAVFYGGSGGGGCADTGTGDWGGGGGGAVKIESAGDITVSGSVMANGGTGAHCLSSNSNTNAEDGSGGGAGGAVYLSGDHVTVGGSVQAKGGKGGSTPVRGGGGGGGGGRIYIRGATSVEITGTASSDGGPEGTSPSYLGTPGGAGSYLVPAVTPVYNGWTGWINGVANGGDISILGTRRYVQYRVNFTTSDDTESPALYNVQANTDPAPAQPILVSVAKGGGSGGGALSITGLLTLTLLLVRRRRGRTSKTT